MIRLRYRHHDRLLDSLLDRLGEMLAASGREDVTTIVQAIRNQVDLALGDYLVQVRRIIDSKDWATNACEVTCFGSDRGPPIEGFGCRLDESTVADVAEHVHNLLLWGTLAPSAVDRLGNLAEPRAEVVERDGGNKP